MDRRRNERMDYHSIHNVPCVDAPLAGYRFLWIGEEGEIMNLRISVFTYYIAKVIGRTSQNKDHLCMNNFIKEETAKKWLQETCTKFREVGMEVSYKGFEKHTIESLEEVDE